MELRELTVWLVGMHGRLEVEGLASKKRFLLCFEFVFLCRVVVWCV